MQSFSQPTDFWMLWNIGGPKAKIIRGPHPLPPRDAAPKNGSPRRSTRRLRSAARRRAAAGHQVIPLFSTNAWLVVLYINLNVKLYVHQHSYHIQLSVFFYYYNIGTFKIKHTLIMESHNTMKELIGCDPNEGLLVSNLFTGLISDKKIVEESGLYRLLDENLKPKEVLPNDSIMFDKGVNISNENKSLGLNYNVLPMATEYQFSEEVLKTRIIASVRESLIRRIKS